MGDRTPNSNDGAGALARIARRAADRLTPDFSEVRHRRIMDAIASAEPRALRIPDAPRPFRKNIALPMGLAAMIALAMGIPTALRLGHRATPQARVPSQSIDVVDPENTEAPLPAIDQAAHRINVRMQDAVQTAMVERQWVGLDHDVRLATQYFVDQAPIRSAIDLAGDEGRK
jgi:hypothetical protein